MKPFTLGDTDIYFTLSRDDISAVFDDDTYVPRVPSAKNVLDLKILGERNETYSISLIYSESQKDFSSNRDRNKLLCRSCNEILK